MSFTRKWLFPLLSDLRLLETLYTTRATTLSCKRFHYFQISDCWRLKFTAACFVSFVLVSITFRSPTVGDVKREFSAEIVLTCFHYFQISDCWRLLSAELRLCTYIVSITFRSPTVGDDSLLKTDNYHILFPLLSDLRRLETLSKDIMEATISGFHYFQISDGWRQEGLPPFNR